MRLSIALPRRLSTAAAALAIATAGSVAFAGAAHATGCSPTANGHTAAVVLTPADPSVINQTIDATGCFYGVYVSPGTDATVSGNNISRYQKAGVFVDGTTSEPVNATITDNTVTGQGMTDGTAQNGIEFRGPNASGLVRGNTIDGNWYTGADWTATGLLLFDVQANQIKTSQNKFIDNQRNLALVTSSSCANQLGGVYGDDGLC